MPYDPKQIEPKWQRFWKDNASFKTSDDVSKPKYYVLDMFPYPSGEGLHAGHPEGYTATDIVARYKRMRGFSREISTTDPDFIRWTQWIFLKLYERGLAYQAEIPVNWCPAQGTVLANEEVKDGKYVETGEPRRTTRYAPVDAQDYGLCRPSAEGSGRTRLARRHQDHAAQLDRPIRRS